jgi:hypothetical protein
MDGVPIIHLQPRAIAEARVKGNAQGIEDKGKVVVYQVNPEQYSPFAKAEKVLRRLPGIEEPDGAFFG